MHAEGERQVENVVWKASGNPNAEQAERRSIQDGKLREFYAVIEGKFRRRASTLQWSDINLVEVQHSMIGFWTTLSLGDRIRRAMSSLKCSARIETVI